MTKEKSQNRKEQSLHGRWNGVQNPWSWASNKQEETPQTFTHFWLLCLTESLLPHPGVLTPAEVDMEQGARPCSLWLRGDETSEGTWQVLLNYCWKEGQQHFGPHLQWRHSIFVSATLGVVAHQIHRELLAEQSDPDFPAGSTLCHKLMALHQHQLVCASSFVCTLWETALP